MADINDRFNVKLTLQIDKIEGDTVVPFDLTVKNSFGCDRIVMHSIESAIGHALIELGDMGIVMLGGEAGEAALAAQKEARGKARGQSK